VYTFANLLKTDLFIQTETQNETELDM